jgi:diguanylate cyclase (GGDEF)-like protein
MDPRWHRTLIAPFKGDGEAVQRISAAALLGTLAPLGLAGAWLAHPHTRPAPALIATAAVLLVLGGRCLVPRPIPGWVWTLHVFAAPAFWYALQLDVARPPDAFFVLMLVLPVGWVGTWLSLRMTLLSIGLEAAVLAAAMLGHGGNGLNVLETAAGIAVIAVVGLMGNSQIVALREARTAAEADAYTDQLTGARSRRYGLLRLEIELDQARTRGPEPPALVMFDIDRFKLVNDAHGHPVGDEVLRELVRRVRAELRPGDELIRWGGEEFLILLPHTADATVATAIAERVRRAAAAFPFATKAGAIAITISAGVAAAIGAGETPDAAVARTDAALYAAKRGGRNCVWAARATLPAAVAS